jgi:hypothetical protein
MAFSGFHPTPEQGITPPGYGLPKDGAPPDGVVGDGLPVDPSEHAATLSAQFLAAIAAVREVSTQVAVYDQVTDHTIRQLHVLAAENATLSAALLAVTAGQIARRSAPERGSEGMARQSGHRTPEEMARSGAERRAIWPAVTASRAADSVAFSAARTCSCRMV